MEHINGTDRVFISLAIFAFVYSAGRLISKLSHGKRSWKDVDIHIAQMIGSLMFIYMFARH